MRIYTIGHSNQPLEPFINALRAHAIRLVADVRRFPTSRRHPHFSGVRLAESLQSVGIAYRHFPELGGRRVPRKNSTNTAWREDAFRGYADYMETAPFLDGIAALLEEAKTTRVAIMCAELTWKQCHRGLIADHLKVLGHDVIHVVSSQRREAHPYTAAARIVEGRLSYQGLL